MEQAIEFVAGTSFLIISISYLLHTNDWMAWMTEIGQAGRHKAVAMGSLGFALSAFIVGFHPVWSGLPLVLTVLGVLGMMEGALYLLWPGSLKKVVSFFTKRKSLIHAMGFVWLLVAVAILYGWWEQVSIEDESWSMPFEIEHIEGE